jgi:hypothetical protein
LLELIYEKHFLGCICEKYSKKNQSGKITPLVFVDNGFSEWPNFVEISRETVRPIARWLRWRRIVADDAAKQRGKKTTFHENNGLSTSSSPFVGPADC